MLFWKFVYACRKYHFTYVLSTYQQFELILRPNSTYENIRIHADAGDYKSLFKKAIVTMRQYAWR